VRLLLDEMIGPRVAQELRNRGLDVVAVAERTDLRALPDDAVLDFARDEGRAVVTRNIADFARLHLQSLAEGRPHAGIVMVTVQAFPQNRGFVGAVVTALAAAEEDSSLPHPGEVIYLKPVRDRPA
jgi:predicted nuclease of predicted toxin-antitoxin system